jgi:transposase-like protein
VVKKVRRATRRQFSAEDKIRTVLEGLRGEDSIAELCRREGSVQNLYYRWSRGFRPPQFPSRTFLGIILGRNTDAFEEPRLPARLRRAGDRSCD